MACNCGCNYGCLCAQNFYALACGCMFCCNKTTTTSTTTTTTICVGEPCEEVNNATCVIYTGPDLPCYGIKKGDDLITILQIAINELGLSCNPTTTTTSTTSTTTSTTSTTSTSTTTLDCRTSGGTIVPLEQVSFFTNSITDAGFKGGLTSTSPVYVDWGDGVIQYFSTGIIPDYNTFKHIYSSAFTGTIKVISVNLTNITNFLDIRYTGTSITTTTVELGKLDGVDYMDLTNVIVTGDVIDLARLLKQFVCSGKNNASTITGDVANLPPDLTYVNILGQNTLYGDVIDFPRSGTSSTYLFNVLGNNDISGDIADLPTVGFTSCSVQIMGKNTITGDIANIPSNYTTVYIDGGATLTTGNTISGDISSLSNTIKTLRIYGKNTIIGDLANLTATSLEIFWIRGDNMIYGNIEDLTITTLKEVEITGGNFISGDISLLSLPALTYLSISGANNISGNIDLSGAPLLEILKILGGTLIGGPVSGLSSNTVLKEINIEGGNTINGNLANMPASVTAIKILGANVINTYSPTPHTWATPMKSIYLTASTNVLPSVIVDQLLIDLATATMVSGSSINLKGSYTSASLLARTALAASGVTINIIP